MKARARDGKTNEKLHLLVTAQEGISAACFFTAQTESQAF